jgi:hypothetical protein
MNPLSQNGNWVTAVTMSLPDYASQMGNRLESIMQDNSLSTVEAHSCALAASLAMGYGELALEISMSSELRGNDIREEVAASVIDMTINNVSRDCFTDLDIKITPYNLAVAMVLKDGASRVVIRSGLADLGYTDEQLMDIAKIAGLIPSIGKCLV